MSFDDLHSNLGASNGQVATEIADVELDARFLSSFVEESEEVHTDDSEMLARLESADTMASGVEARLDGILDTLDDLLTRLEPKDGNSDPPQQATIPRSESQSERPPSSSEE